MEKVLNMTFASSLTNLCEINDSFDTGVLKICYAGENRNKSNISKEAIEDAIKTLYNCPIVCNYDRESDTLGGHDMEVVKAKDGTLRLVNLTSAIGVIPESAKVWFQNFEEEDGSTHEYLCAEVLLWKRQEAYSKIKNDGITAHSMEITVKDGEMVDDIYYIKSFVFTAFALIGVEPCFEGSALQMFSKENLKEEFSKMMQELKENANLITTQNRVDDKHPQDFSTEGGNRILDEKLELVAKYGLKVEDLDFSIEDFSIEELTAKFEEMAKDTDEASKEADEPAVEEPAAEEPAKEDGDGEEFALVSNIVDEVKRALSKEQMEDEWGTYSRYFYVDCDFEKKEVYCWDSTDWLLYGFTYSADGDSIAVDFESKKRKKFDIVNFDEGEQASPIAAVFEAIESKLKEKAEFEGKYQAASEKIESMEGELSELREFKADVEKTEKENKVNALFAKFEDLADVEGYEELKEQSASYELDVLEEKLYALRGRNGTVAKFSANQKAPKIIVEKNESDNDEPYGGIFRKYGIDK